MDTDRISIARVLALGVPLTWEDAVAVAHQAAMLIEVDSVMSDQPLLVTAESCLISRAGHLDCTSVTDQAAPDAVLTLLRRMLDGSDPPPEIAALAAEGATPDIYGALDSIAVGNRHARIAELAARALAPPADVAAPAAVAPPPRPVATPKPAALSETAPESAPVAKPPPVPTPDPVPVQAGSSLAAGAMLVVSTRDTDGPSTGGHDAEFRRLRTRALLKPGRHGIGSLRRRSLDLNLSPASRRRVAGVAAVVIGVLIPVGWLVARADRVEVPALPASPLAVPKALAAKSVAQAMAAAAAPQRPATPVRSAPTSNMLVAVPQPVNPPLAISRVPQLAASVPYVSARPAPPARELSPPVSAREVEAAPTAAARDAVVSPAVDDVAVYSATDFDVAPPVFIRPQVRSSMEPGAEVPPGWSYLELIIDRAGLVELVRLFPAPVMPGESQYRQRMLVAAAKAWRFVPAHRDGTPVRYAIRVPLEP